MLALAGIKNVWSKSFGQTKNKINVLKATVSALRKLSQVQVQQSNRPDGKYQRMALIIEDSIVIRKTMVRALKTLGIDVVLQAQAGVEGLKLLHLHSQTLEVVFCDWIE